MSIYSKGFASEVLTSEVPCILWIGGGEMFRICAEVLKLRIPEIVCKMIMLTVSRNHYKTFIKYFYILKLLLST